MAQMSKTARNQGHLDETESERKPVFGDASTDSAASSAWSSAAPSVGPGDSQAASFASIPTLADYLVNGYWDWKGKDARSWADPTDISCNIQDLTAAEQAIALQALSLWDDVCDVTFTFTTGAADITFINDGSGDAVTSSNVSGTSLVDSTVKISSDWDGGAAAGNFSYFFQTYVHEIGHALGLGHQGPYNGSATYGVDNIFTNDTWRWSVMSYFDQIESGNGDTYDYVLTPQMADIYAVQSIYGAQTTRTGNTTYGFNSTAGSFFDFSSYFGTPAFTFYDTGGTDTFDASEYSNDQTIDLSPGSWSSIGGEVNNIGIYLTTTIENAKGGSGDDVIIGNAANNNLYGNDGDDTLKGVGGADFLSGGDGNDTLDGGSGADNMDGGFGNDTYIVNNAGDVAAEVAGGTDTVQASVTHTLSTNLENLTLTGTGDIDGGGNAKNNVMTGNAGDNVLSALGGNDTLDGKDGDDVLVGGDGDDTLSGGDGDDTLKGVGGADNMNGGLGNDLYLVDDAGDVAGEVAGGTDTVEASVTHTLSGNLENVTLTGSADIDGSGNFRANVITGNDGSNVLSGLGGADTLVGGDGDDTVDGGTGADDMNGGLGNDLYVVDDAGDVAGEVAGGTDTVEASVAHTLSVNLENLTLTGSANIGGTGNAKANVITGNAGNNVLSGLGSGDTLAGGDGNDTLDGGDGNDTLDGGAGNDTLKGAGGADSLSGGSGVDLASYVGSTTGISVNLSTGVGEFGDAEGDTYADVENVYGTSGGDALIGNASANTLSGADGNDSIQGLGGDDTLSGGAGNDTLDGGGGKDTASYAGAAAGVTISLAVAGPQDTGGADSDTLSNIENLTGSHYDDVLTAGAGANILLGGAGNDTLSGGGGSDTLDGGSGKDTASYDGASAGVTVSLEIAGAQDTGGAGSDTLSDIERLTGSDFDDVLAAGAGTNILRGGEGDDTLDGGGGKDTLVGGLGRDIMTGGGNPDTFDFNAFDESVTGNQRDRITDFVQGSDTIDLGTIDADTTVANNQAFVFIGAAAFSGIAGELRQATGANTVVMGDINGDGAADFHIQLDGSYTLAAADFSL